MQIRVIDGRRATDRRGTAEYLDRSLKSVDLWASRRDQTGFPAPVAVETTGRGVRVRGAGLPQGREWYALRDLDAFKVDYIDRVETSGRARVHRVQLIGDPEELLNGQQIATELKIDYATWRSWVRDSKDAWAAGRDGYIPCPDQEEPYGRGVTRRWRRRTIQAFVDNRSGRVPSPGRPRPRADAHEPG